MEVFRSETRVGLLLIASFLLLVVGIFVVSDLRSLWNEKKTVELLFPYADGITKGSPVWYAGLEVGEVTDVRIARGTADRIAITVTISPEARVRKDSRVDIRSLGMMGAKYVEISPGSSDTPELAPGDVLEGKTPSSLTEVIASGQKVADHLVQLVQETQSLIHDVRTQAPVKETVQNANAFLSELRDQGKALSAVLKKVDSFTDTLNATGQNVQRASGEGGKELTALIRELRDTNRTVQKRLETVEVQLTKTLGAIGKGATEAESGIRDVRTVVAGSGGDVAALLRNLSATSEELKALSEDLREHPWKVIWKKDGTPVNASSAGTDQWRDKGRIGPHGKE